MGFESRQRIVKTAVASVVMALGIASVGCDRRGGASPADQKAVDLMGRNDFQAAAKEKQTSPMLLSLAASRAANDQYAATLPQYDRLADQQLNILQAMWQTNRLAQRVQEISASSKTLANYDPKATLGAVDQTVAQVKGQDAPTWAPADVKVAIPTIAAATAEINKLKDRKAEIERTLADLKQQRDTLSQKAAELLEKSNNEKGQQSVDLFKQASDTRKQAADLDVQVAQTEASLVPVNHDLATIQQAADTLTQTLTKMGDVRDSLEKGWRGVTKEAQDEQAYAVATFNNADKDAVSVANRSRALAEMIQEHQKDADSYDAAIQAALGSAHEAGTAADAAAKELTLLLKSEAGKGSQASAWKGLQQVIDPSGARFDEAMMVTAAGSNQAALAVIYGTQARIAEQLALAAQSVGQSVPQGMAAADARKNLQESSDKATNSFKTAADTMESVSQAVLASDTTKKAATVGQITALYSQAAVAADAGKNDDAKTLFTQAVTLRDKLAENGAPLPSLPGALGSAPATTQPAAGGNAGQPVENQ